MRTIEQRKMTDDEINKLVSECEPSEVRLFSNSFFNDNCFAKEGFLVDGRPIYLAGLFKEDERIKFCTVVNKDTNSIITMSRYAKKQLKNWIDKFGELYATMEKINKENMKWVQWLGFIPFEEDENFITYRIGE